MRLRAAGAQPEGDYDEDNLRFEGGGKPRRTSLRLRVLDGGPAGILTTKGPARFVRGIKVREETEVGVSDVHAARDILESLGYLLAFSYAKHRSVWRLGPVAVTLDTLDFGWFTELEGPIEDLEAAAAGLGLDPKQAVKESYAAFARKAIGQTG